MRSNPSSGPDREQRGSVALDQWRGLALVMVLISHGFFYTNRVNGIGRVGVNLFFFISGILVFRSLSRSRATAWDRTKSFWWRRTRRLYPAMATYTLAMLPVVWFCQNLRDLPPDADFHSYLKGMPVAFCYMEDFFEIGGRALGHLWSLGCEMQFYMLAPLIYLAGGSTEKRRVAVFGSLLIILMTLGVLQPFIGKGKYQFEFAVWPMMVGFCCEYKRRWIERLPRLLASLTLWLGVVICGAAITITFFHTEMKPLVIATGALLLAPCLVAYVFGRPMIGGAGRMMKWVGERTYSIYLWQQPFTICDYLPNPLHPAGALVSVAVGGIWFHFFERPFLSASRREQVKET